MHAVGPAVASPLALELGNFSSAFRVDRASHSPEVRGRRSERDPSRSERVEDGGMGAEESEEQERLREAGSQGLFGGESVRFEEDEADEQQNTGGASTSTADISSAELLDDRVKSPQHNMEATAVSHPSLALVPPAAATSLPPLHASASPVADPSTQSRVTEFAVPLAPTLSSARKRGVNLRKIDEFSVAFSLPPNYAANLQIPSAMLANVSPVSHDYSAANFSPAPRFPSSTLPPPIQTHTQPGNFPTIGYAASPNPLHSSSSPMHPSTGSIRSPSFGPSAAPSHFWPPSSPRQDVIPSITARIEQWQRSGRIATMIKHANQASDAQRFKLQPASTSPNIHQHASSVISGQPPTAFKSNRSLSLSTGSRLPHQSSRSALTTIDRYLRRRHVFAMLDADLIVKGIVYSKTSDGLLITIDEICNIDNSATNADINNPPPLTRNVSLPVLSSAFNRDREDDFSALEELGIRGECHLTEIQAAIINEMRNSSQAANGAAQRPRQGLKTVISTSSPADSSSILDTFTVGDAVKALVISVDTFAEKVYLSMNNARLKHAQHVSAQSQPLHRLGPCKENRSPNFAPASAHSTPGMAGESAVLASFSTLTTSASIAAPPLVSQSFPSFQRALHASSTPAHHATTSLPSSLVKPPRPRRRPKDFLSWLRRQSLFLNPAGLGILIDAYDITEHGSLMLARPIEDAERYDVLRKEQNERWAKDSVAKGIALAKRGSYETALKVYDHAIEIEPSLASAYVAKGACYVLMKDLERACEQFERALEIEPTQPHARHYLQQARRQLNDRLGITAHCSPSASNPRDAMIDLTEPDMDEAFNETQLSQHTGHKRRRSNATGASDERAPRRHRSRYSHDAESDSEVDEDLNDGDFSDDSER